MSLTNQMLVEQIHSKPLQSSFPCPVCTCPLVLAELRPFEIVRGGSTSNWARCATCRSYFELACWDRDTELSRFRTAPYGVQETALKLNSYKLRLYLSALRLLLQHAPPRSSILDAGCAFGGFLEQARIHGFAPRGMDILPEAVEYNKRRGIPCEVAASVSEVHIPDSSLDILSAMDCHYYWPDQRCEIRAAWKKLRPGGLLLLRVADKSWMLTLGLALRKTYSLLSARLCAMAAGDHRVSIPVPTMLRLLREEGFEILYASPRGAMHSDDSSFAVKTSFAIGFLVWHLARRNIAPGALVLGRKPSET